MKKSIYVRFFISLLLLVSLLSPVSAVAFDNGKKHFKEGMKHEEAQVWDKAVEEFALAVSESPKNPEYRLHLARALFNASQMFMKRGTTAAAEKDFEAAYVAFRRAYAFDPTNELAKSEMDRMVRLQQQINDASTDDVGGEPGKVKLVPTGYVVPTANAAPPQIPQKLEKLRDLPFPGGVDLQFIVKELARDLDLNVLFDVESFRQPRKVFIDLKNVTGARALDYIFLQEGLFFQKVGPRTIIVAGQQQRQKFQQLVLRTFYLANAAPKDVAKVVQTAIPAQPGRSQTIVLTDDSTNSITIRDTEENIRLIGQLIKSLDKDRAEVVMDVAIYEVNRSDLLQLGNQIGTQSQLTNLGGSQPAAVKFGSNPILNALGAALPTAIATGIILPAANISAFQSNNNTKLIASTQIHAFNNEDSSARIGQRVPVRSATFQTGGGAVNQGNNGVVSDVINYEQVGLTLKFKPIVFPNQDVQVAMEIESKDVSGAQTLTPTFTERTIKGTARIQNNKTLLLASVAQGVESNGRAGLPLLGLIPI
ncbi:MAG: secretin N-terminal domain-containing protein, partial [Pyrinomonadaceae bacterium]